jgi:hypothetical protein
MAIVHSIAIGKARKTAGEWTYRNVGGKTIASRRIRKNDSKTEPQLIRRKVFTLVSRIAKSLSPLPDVTFPKTKFGSRRNAFMKANKTFMDTLAASDIDAIFREEADGMEIFLNIVNANDRALSDIVLGKADYTVISAVRATVNCRRAQSVYGYLDRDIQLPTDVFHLWFAALLTTPEGAGAPLLSHLEIPAWNAAVTVCGEHFTINLAEIPAAGRWQEIPGGLTLTASCRLISVTHATNPPKTSNTKTSNTMIIPDNAPAYETAGSAQRPPSTCLRHAFDTPSAVAPILRIRQEKYGSRPVGIHA